MEMFGVMVTTPHLPMLHMLHRHILRNSNALTVVRLLGGHKLSTLLMVPQVKQAGKFLAANTNTDLASHLMVVLMDFLFSHLPPLCTPVTGILAAVNGILMKVLSSFQELFEQAPQSRLALLFYSSAA